ncbi:MAG TPA: sulfite exporter TauE/SafE family protein [Ignavibacteria bacterium]|nr:sulfite exporter TauE/SafE family protein [Ignavibacteria bacterium]
MSIEIILILFGVGILTGVLAGMFGVGGGVIVVPALISVYSYLHIDSPYTVHIAIATSLFTIIFTSISSTLKHSTHGNVVHGAALIIGITSSIAVFLFSSAAVHLNGELLKTVFSVIIAAVAVKLIVEKRKEETPDTEGSAKKYNKIYSAVIGVFTGMIAAFSGLGGGVFAVPLMHYFLKFNIKKAIGTSTLAILITSCAGVLSYIINKPADLNFGHYTLGLVDVYSALPIIAASIPFAQLGVWIHKRTHYFILKKLFAVFILAVAVKMIFF